MRAIAADVLIDGRVAGDAMGGLRVQDQRGRRNLVTTARTDAVRKGLERGQRLLNQTKLFQGEQLYRQGRIEFMFCSRLVYRIGEQFRGSGEMMRPRGFVREHRTKSMEFVLKIDVMGTLSFMNVRGFRPNSSWHMPRGVCGLRSLPYCPRFYNFQSTRRLPANQICVT